MRRVVTLILAGGMALAVACVPEPEVPRLLLRGVTLIDGTGSPPVPSTTIVIRGRRVEAVVPDSEIRIGPRDSVIDGAGLWAIPGLFDAHVHLSKTGPEALPVLAAMGVTSVRDMGGDLEALRTMQSAV
ncbi:MAG TPA: hypothetical protein VMN39_12080, partial [Longimicrobiaceae bacterium]|nr:hypothetical protein [Longimicrobiaceae bacterium]